MIELSYPIERAMVLNGSSGAAAEMLPIVDRNGNVYAQASREYCHSGTKVLHPVVHLHVINRSGELYLQKRSASRKLLPLKWDTAVGGHVSYGEYLMEALFREAWEELGFVDFNPCFLTSYMHTSQIESELVNSFAAVGNFTLTPDKDEVADGRFWNMSEIEANLGSGLFTPNFEEEFDMVKKDLLSLL